MKIKLFLTFLIILIMPSVLAADPITDKVHSIVHYAEQFELGQISYTELQVYSNALREDIREQMSEVVFGREMDKYEGISESAAKSYFGKPTGYTDWVWIVNEDYEVKIDEKMPKWEKVVFDGKKIQITFNAWPQIYKGEDGVKKFYWVDFNVRFKKQFNFDLGQMQSEVKSLGQSYLSNQQKAEELARKLVEYSSLVQAYLEQNKENCEVMLKRIFGNADKTEDQEFITWETELYSGDSFTLLVTTRMCDSCEWVWADTRMEPRFNGPFFENMKSDFKYDESDYEQFKNKDVQELLSMLKKEFLNAKQAAENFEKTKSNFNLGQFSSRIQMIQRALSEYYNWDYNHREENKKEYLNAMDNILNEVGDSKRTRVKELRYENRLVEDTIQKSESWCRQVQEEECAIDEGCIDGACKFALGGDEDCKNQQDDDSDQLIDCMDPDCARECGRLCQDVCQDECWPCMHQCEPVCKECNECQKDGGDCQDVCQDECWSCQNDKCYGQPVCSDCRSCQEEGQEQPTCDNECRPCNTCVEEKGGDFCEEECKQCVSCKSPSENPKCKEGCDTIIKDNPSELQYCYKLCEDNVVFYCSGAKQYSPCPDTTYICNGKMQSIPCEIFTCVETKQTVPCGQEAFCGENQIAEGERCKCRAGYYDCDKDGKSCESKEACGEAQEVCSDQQDNDDDLLIDCEDRMDCKYGMICGKEKVCYDGDCISLAEQNITVKCGEHQVYENGECVCEESYIMWENECKPLFVELECDEGYELVNGVCLEKSEGECYEGYSFENGVCKPEKEVSCPEGYEFLDDKCLPIIGECPSGFELKDGACVQIEVNKTEEGCPEGFEEVDDKCVSPLIDCPQYHEFVDGECKPIEFECELGYYFEDWKCVKEIEVINCPSGYVFENNECVFKGLKCAEEEILESGQCVSKEIFENREVELEDTGKTCILASDCGSERAVCSNGYCKEIPQEIYDEEYSQENYGEVVLPDVVEETMTFKQLQEGYDRQIGVQVQVKEQEREEDKHGEPEIQRQEEVQEQHEEQVQEELGNEVTGAVSLWSKITGFFVKEEGGCSSDDECNQNQKCDSTMGNCYCEYGFFDCNGYGDGRDSDGCESKDPTCGGMRELCPGGCNENQYCDEKSGNCQCDKSFSDCDGNWMNGCEFEGQCAGCKTDDNCAAPVCSEWNNRIIKFGCVEGEGWLQENGVIGFSGGCVYKQDVTESYLHFDSWGEAFKEVDELRRTLENQGSWCKFELEGYIKERKELQDGLNQEFLEWFFDEYLVEEPDKWENRIGGIHDIYWTLVENARETARTTKCMGKNDIPSEYVPINIEYESDFGKVRIWEEMKYVDEFNMEVLSPYMEIWVFPPKEVFKQEIIKAREGGYIPGPPEDRMQEIGPSAQEKAEMKKHPEALKEIEDLVEDYDDGSLDVLLTLKEEEGNLYNVKIQINPDVIFSGKPVKTIDFEPDVTVEVQLDFLYNMIKKTEQRGELQSPPWDKARGVRNALSNAVETTSNVVSIVGAIASGNVKIKPLSAIPKAIKIVNMASDKGEEPMENVKKEDDKQTFGFEDNKNLKK
ncbi:MAG: hypothetical protein KKB39_01480 [Nanoarchaeota archaeon]|nr:hypothetical protein [Nanoarchaeota archaeon]